jgi:hypothetical protein
MTAAKTEIEHGTYGGYQQCRRRSEGSCAECKAANRTYIAEYRRRRPHVTTPGYANERARDRALRKLARRFPAEFESLYAAEMARQRGLS